MRFFGEQFVNDFAIDFSTGGKNFDRVNVGVFVDDASGDAVVFGVYEAKCAFFVMNVETAALAGGDSSIKDVAKEFPVDFRVSSFATERPETPTDLGFRGVGGKAQKIALVAVNFDNVTKFRVTDNFVNGTAKNPGMVTEGGLIAPGFECNRFHGRKFRKKCYISFIGPFRAYRNVLLGDF